MDFLDSISTPFDGVCFAAILLGWYHQSKIFFGSNKYDDFSRKELTRKGAYNSFGALSALTALVIYIFYKLLGGRAFDYFDLGLIGVLLFFVVKLFIAARSYYTELINYDKQNLVDFKERRQFNKDHYYNQKIIELEKQIKEIELQRTSDPC